MGDFTGWIFVCLVLGGFGLSAYLKLDDVKKRLRSLEEALEKIDGTDYALKRRELREQAQALIGEVVVVSFKEEENIDPEVVQGNASPATNTLLDADEDWVLLEMKSLKETKTILLRLDGVDAITQRV